MANFYDEWLGFWDKNEEAKGRARKAIHEEEIEWVKTPQDAKVGLLVAPETGFRTWGTVSMVAEIPVGWHTGSHIHGEEGIHIVEGEGFSVVNGQRYDWAKGSTVWIPFGGEHQHFNTGSVPARYYSLMAVHLENFVGLHKMEQVSECGYTEYLPEAPANESGLDSKDRRIRLWWEDGTRNYRADEHSGPTRHQGSGPLEAEEAEHATTHSAHTSLYIDAMKPALNFENREIELSGVISDDPHTHGGKHAHMEAILYILQGEGYSVCDGEKVPWKKGTCFQVQGPQTVHQHFNTGDVPSHMLRGAAGVRMKFFQQVARERFPYLWYESRGPVE